MTKPALPSSIDDLLDLLATECNAEQIQDLLRGCKEDLDKDRKKEIRVSAENKETLLKTNLRRAISEGLVPKQRAWELLREAEENGSQHVFYYVPKNKNVARSMQDHVTIAKVLLREHGLDHEQLPRVVNVPDKYTFADFHVHQPEGDGSMKWVAKFYGSESYREKAGKEKFERGLTWIPYRDVKKRTVLVAIYRGWGILELRVPRLDSAPLISKMHEQLWEMIGPSVARADLSEWDLTRAKRRLLEEHDKHDTLYTVGTTLLGDGDGGTALISPHGDDDNLFTAKARENLVGAYLESGAACRNLRVVWHAQEDRTPKTERIVTVMGSTRKAAPSNEIIATGKVSAGTMDHVAHRLREFQS